MNYYDWHNGTHECHECGWSGTGSETTYGEHFRDGVEHHCPQCDKKFCFVPHPLISEVLSDSRAGQMDRKMAAIIKEGANRIAEQELKSANQLPDLQPSPAKLIWDVEYVDGLGKDSYIIILDGEQVIWREISTFEEYERFGEIASLLWQKYGETLRDLEPTQGSGLNLYGDRLSSLGTVARNRESLARGEDPAEH